MIHPEGSEPAVWTSLAIAKLLVDLLLPIALVGLGIVIDHRTKRIEQAIWDSRRETEWKQKLFDRTIADFNKLYCAFNYVGDWQELSPREIVVIKRRLDREMKSYSMLLGDETMRTYDDLMAACFDTERGRQQKIKLKANRDMYEQASSWQDRFVDMFVAPDQRCRRSEFNNRYTMFVRSFFRAVGVHKV